MSDELLLTPEKAIEIIERWQAGGFATRIDDMNPALNLAVKALKCKILQNRLDRPELRGIIGKARERHPDGSVVYSGTELLKGILALIPDREEAREDGFTRGITHYREEICPVRIEEAKREERERLGQELEDVGLVTPAHDGCCIVSLAEHKWWRAIMRLRSGQALGEK